MEFFTNANHASPLNGQACPFTIWFQRIPDIYFFSVPGEICFSSSFGPRLLDFETIHAPRVTASTGIASKPLVSQNFASESKPDEYDLAVVTSTDASIRLESWAANTGSAAARR
jgi:hypothetical protein